MRLQFLYRSSGVRKLTIVLGTAVLAVAMTASSPAWADSVSSSDPTFSWNYVPTSGTDTGGSGTLTATPDGSGMYLITGITGTWDGSAISGLLPPGTCCSTPPNDNILYYPGQPGFLDTPGLGFGFMAGGYDVNIYGSSGTASTSDAVLTAPSGNTSDTSTTSTGTFAAAGTISTVPEPAPFVLLGSGLVCMALLVKTRRGLPLSRVVRSTGVANLS